MNNSSKGIITIAVHKDITKEEILKLNDKENFVSPEQASSRARKIVKKGDIIYATVRPYLHNMCIIDKDFEKEPIASTGFAVLACYPQINNQYLF